MATTTPPPKHERHASRLFHRHRSDTFTGSQRLEQKGVFEGTDAVAQNRKVAVQRVVEVHDALEQQHQAEAAADGTSRSSSPASSMSSDVFTIDFSDIPFPDAEVRTFRYFLRRWDPSAAPDPGFDAAIHASRQQFEEAAVKHFFRRIALWHASEEAMEAARQNVTRRWRSRDRHEGQLTKMWMAEKDRQGQAARDELKLVTSREGLAQLLWTLLHDPTDPVAPELLEECTKALKKYYGIKPIN